MKTIYVLEIRSEAECEEPLSAYFESAENLGFISEQKIENNYAAFKIFFDSEPAVEKIKTDIKNIFQDLKNLGLQTGCEEMLFYTLKEEDWQNSWKKNFTAFKAGKHLVIKPSWENWVGDGIIIHCDPGMAFGTGQHPTTKFCLEMLDMKAGTYKSVLDMGCGSGILSVAAAKLGAECVIGFDNDPLAVEASEDLAVKNGVESVVKIYNYDLDSFKPLRKYDFILANLFAEMLIKYADKIAGAINPNGYIAVTGIINAKAGAVKEAFSKLGINKIISSFTDDEWSGFLFQS